MYVGLVDDNGVELQAPEYHRICLDDMTWGMTHDVDPTSGKIKMVFCNLQPLRFPRAKSDWGRIRSAIFVNESGDPPLGIWSEHVGIPMGVEGCFFRGSISIDGVT